MILPRIPRKGEHILPWAQELTLFLKSIVPRAGNHIQLLQGPGGMAISALDQGIDQSKVPFGYRILNDSEIRIYNGYIEHGINLYQALQKDVTLINGTQFIYVAYDWGSNASIEDPVSVRPVTSDTTFVKVLYQITKDATYGSVAIDKFEWMGGNIHIPGAFA